MPCRRVGASIALQERANDLRGALDGDKDAGAVLDDFGEASERFYPAFQLVSWADKSPAEAMKVAIAEAYGRA